MKYLLTALLALTSLPAFAQWTKRFDIPELSALGYASRPQAILALDNDDLIVTAHFGDQFSRAYRVTPSTNTVTGQFQFPLPYRHIAAAAQRSDGSIWFADYTTGCLLLVDLPASFASGTAVILESRKVSDPSVLSGLAWATVGTDEYLLMAEYRTSGSPTMVILHNESGRRMPVTIRVQGIAYRDGLLYISSNAITGQTPAVGTVQVIDFHAFITMGPTNHSWTNYVISTSLAPSNYPEDLSFSPDGTLWTQTEGNTSVGTAGYLGAWSL